MPKLKILSGLEIISILKLFNFLTDSQKGSHIKLVRIKNGTREVLVIPNHKELDKGTISGIYKQASKFISIQELQKHFYND
ncbi:MAG: hypothetical protein LiPW41_371 [Parcubacteria group bacterium LiPW_41]|nr:MAG: hypothetical protein LiPW41_371 [Parcubacteria group bacterium LiPW_41]